jgi:hypothetical protein
MDDRMISLVLILVVVMSGVNSVVVLVAVGDSGVPGHITVTVDPAMLFSELQESPVPIPTVYSVEEDEPETEYESDIADVDNTDHLRETFHTLATLFRKNSYLIVGEKAETPDVLGAANISYALAWGGCQQNPESRTDMLLTDEEHDTGNLIVVGGPAVNELAVELGKLLRITYEYNINESFKINAESKSIYLDLEKYPEEDICIVYLREFRGRNILMVWGYGWQGTLAGSIFVANPDTWKDYEDCRMVFLRWKDLNEDGLIQESEITVEESL